MVLCGIIRRFQRLSPRKGQIVYALLTRAPLVSIPKDLLPYDLHVLSLPLAFILSQDQTLHSKSSFVISEDTTDFFCLGFNSMLPHFLTKFPSISIQLFLAFSPFSLPLFSKASAKVQLLFKLPNFLQSFLIFIFIASQHLASLSLSRLQKYDSFLNFQTFYKVF